MRSVMVSTSALGTDSVGSNPSASTNICHIFKVNTISLNDGWEVGIRRQMAHSSKRLGNEIFILGIGVRLSYASRNLIIFKDIHYIVKSV